MDDTTYLQQNSAAPSKSGTANKWKNPEQHLKFKIEIYAQYRDNPKLVEDNVRCDKVKLITLVISSYNIHNNPNKGFNFASGRLDNIAKSTERILEKWKKYERS